MNAPSKTTIDRESSIIDLFQELFSVQVAVSQEQKDAVYAVRYRVYCEEHDYEPADQFPDGLEQDEFDSRSLHCLITHRPSGVSAGCVRLVGTGGRRNSDQLPSEVHCPGSISPEFLRGLGVERDHICEISRLAIDRRFRRRPGAAPPTAVEQDVDGPEFTEQEIHTFPLIATAGFLAATALTEITGRTHVFALMEPYLPRLLRQAGFMFQRAGGETEYHGMRAAYYCKTEWAINRLRPELRTLYDTIHSGLDESIRVLDGWPFTEI